MPDGTPPSYEIDILQYCSDGGGSRYKVFVNSREEGELLQELNEDFSLVKFYQDSIEKGRVETNISGDADWVKTARTQVTEMLRRDWPYAKLNWYTHR
jgi:hypothetical protein